MNEWIPCTIINQNIIDAYELRQKECSILVTYKTRYGRLYVKQCICSFGRISKKLNGDIIAWMPLPKPYKEEYA